MRTTRRDRGADIRRGAYGHRDPHDRPRRPPQPRRASRRAAHAPDRQRRGAGGRVRRLPVAEPRPAAPDQPPATNSRSRARSQRVEGPTGQAVLAQQAVLELSRACADASSGSSQRPAAALPAARSRAVDAAELAACAPPRREIPPHAAGGKADDAGDRRAVHDDAHGRLLLRADHLAAGDPVRAVWLRAARPAAE